MLALLLTTLLVCTTALPLCDLSSHSIRDCEAHIASTWSIAEDTELTAAMLYCDVTRGDYCIQLASGVNLKMSSGSLIGNNTETCINMSPSSTLTMTNTTQSGCGHIHDLYGGVARAQTDNVITVTDSLLSGNEAFNGAVFFLNHSTLTLARTELRDNMAINLGGVFALVESAAVITDSTINFNDAQDGGAVYMIDSTVYMATSLITGNHAIVRGDDVSCMGDVAQSNLTMDKHTYDNAHDVYTSSKCDLTVLP